MTSGDGPARIPHDQETTEPPPGMYSVQMQGLRALRPIEDVDHNDVHTDSSQHTENCARLTPEQPRVPLTDADRQWLAQSAGAACSAAALTEASTPSEGEGSSRPERLPRTQGVVEFGQQHCSPSFAAAVAHDTARVQSQPVNLPLPVAAQPQDVPEQNYHYQGWPDWLLQWGQRVEDVETSDHAPGPSTPPSVPPSPPGRRSAAWSKCPCSQQLVRPPTAPEAQHGLQVRLWLTFGLASLPERRSLAAWMPNRGAAAAA